MSSGNMDTCEDNELLVKTMVSIPNIAITHYTICFSGWNVQLHPDGTWSVEDTGGCLEKILDFIPNCGIVKI